VKKRIKEGGRNGYLGKKNARVPLKENREGGM